MALLQAVPDLPRDDDDERDALLEPLAAQFSPEDVQLCYQIAITSRRDLDYAPDAARRFRDGAAAHARVPAGAKRRAGDRGSRVPQRARASSVPRAASVTCAGGRRAVRSAR